LQPTFHAVPERPKTTTKIDETKSTPRIEKKDGVVNHERKDRQPPKDKDKKH
jgi:hypothetical protein